jgi:protocatechuate 3,4-dioxygenase, beta subunit
MASMIDVSRRGVLAAGASLLALRALPADAALALTPAQTEGPFYPLALPLDSDNDLVEMAGRSERATGTILHLGGKVVDPEGRPVRGAALDIWQCDGFGVYHHPRAGGEPDMNFQGFGRTLADGDGAYRFRTIVPVPYPGRTPHIHFKIAGPGFEPLTTQMYLKGHPLNAEDFIYRRLGARASLVTVDLVPTPALEPAAKSGAMRALFEIVLGPDGVPRDS